MGKRILYSVLEDTQLGRVYVCVSEDPIRGKDRSSATLQSQMQEKFQEYMKENDSLEQYKKAFGRKAAPLFGRFKDLAKDMLEYMKANKLQRTREAAEEVTQMLNSNLIVFCSITIPILQTTTCLRFAQKGEGGKR